MVQISGLAGSMARLFTEAAKPNTEYQFNLIQNTTITRINDEIDDIVAKYDRSDEVRGLEKQRARLADDIPLLEQYRFQSIGNKARLDKAYDEIISALSSFSSADDDDEVLTAEEAAAINTSKDFIREKIKETYYLTNPDVNPTDTILYLKSTARELDDFTAVAGPVDPEGTDQASATNDNRALKDLLNNLLTKTLGTVESTTSTIRVSYNIIEDYNTKIAEIDAEFVEIQAVDTVKVNEEIDEVKARYANFLQAMSLSFDLQNQYTEGIAKSLHDRSIEPGSVMNLFS